MLKGNVKLTGSLAIAVNGEVVREVKNLVVNTGKEHVTNRLLASPTEGAMSHMAVGSGSTAAAAADTALGTELGRDAFDSTPSIVGSNTIVFVTTFDAGTGTGALTEAGIFNAATSGATQQMFARTVFSTVTKGSADTMTITWTITVSAS